MRAISNIIVGATLLAALAGPVRAHPALLSDTEVLQATRGRWGYDPPLDPPWIVPAPPPSMASCTPEPLLEPANHDPRRRYPRAVIDRPPIVPLGVVLASVDLSRTDEDLHGAVLVEAGLPGGFDARLGYQGTAGAHRVVAGVGKHLAGGAWWSAAVRTQVDYDAGARTWGTSTTGVRLAATLGRLAAWVRPEQLAIDLAGEKPARVIAPLSLGVQVSRIGWLQLDGDVPVAEVQADRLVPLPMPAAVPVALTTIVSVTPAIDLRLRIGADVTRDGITPPTSWLFGLGYILGR